MRWVVLAMLAACKFDELELDAGAPALPDGNTPPVDCDDDSLEPNDTVQDPTIPMYEDDSASFANLTLCSFQDEDMFLVPVEVANQSIEVVVLAQQGDLGLALLDAGGGMIANGMELGGTSFMCVPNLPMGVYFIGTFGGADTHYRISIQLTNGCN